MKISVVVTNFNTVKLLKKHLPDIIAKSDVASEIIVADDASADGSLEYLKEISPKYPKLKILKHKTNVRFSKNSNDAVKMATGELVVLLNSDISPSPDYIQPCLHHFKDPSVFGVGFAEINHENYGHIFWKNGYIQTLPGHSSSTHISGWVSGGSCIIRKDIFQKLGGFDEIYSPFYSEDLDLGYRAWKSGYQCLWEPKSKVDHQHEGTNSKFSKRFLDYVKERNRLLTVWRNITDKDMLFQNKLALIGRVLTGPNYIKIILAASRQINSARPPIVFPKLTDRQIFDLFK